GEMRRRALEADRVDLPAEAFCVVAEGAAVRLDRVEADPRELLQLGLERQEIARAVELERYPVVAHLWVLLSSGMRDGIAGSGPSDAFAALRIEERGVGRLEPGLDRLAGREGIVGTDAHRHGF